MAEKDKKDEKADVTLAPNVRHAGMDFRRDTNKATKMPTASVGKNHL